MYFTQFTLPFIACIITSVNCNNVSPAQGNLHSTIPNKHDPTKDTGVEYAAVKLINVTDFRQFRKRPANIVQYQITLDNETFSITLRPNKNLFTPGCLVHSYLPNGTKDIHPCSRESVDCYYTGHSDIHQESWVAANVCSGLNGVISYENTSLLIEPALNHTSPRDNQEHVHIVHRFEGDKHISPINDISDSPGNDLHVVYGRKKRSVSSRYIETRVVVDPTMYHYHRTRDNAIAYTLMAFNIASKMYEHPSIGTSIYLTLSELHVIESYDQFASELTEKANKTLKTFCEWQASLTTEQIDCSVLLTRLDLEDDNGMKGINGLARLNQMCDKNLKCALVEDEGPMMGITLAHEIGHLLGMTHDDKQNGIGIMSASGWSGSEAFTWSNHSAMELQQSLESNHLNCLKNKPAGFAQNRPEFPLPGTLYTADQQCHMRTNNSYMFYTSTYSQDDPCKNLKCRYTGDQVLEFSTPLLDGTDCNNTRMWCIRGECMPIDSTHRPVSPVDGSWSSWQSFTTCSRSCGGGVQIQRRYCNNPPPQYGGKECPGLSSKERICNMEECSSDYRQQQCSELNTTQVSNGLVPALGDIGDSSCNISCQGDKGIVTTNIPYLDGTECLLKDSASYSRCVNGKCQNFGCDWLSNSKLKYDECGVCNGRGTTCNKVTGKYEQDAPTGSYTNVTTIPAGSSGILIHQTNVYCLLSIVVDGHRILNDGMEKSGSAVFNLYGIQLRYMNNRRKGETVEIVEKIEKDIVVQTLRFYDYHKYQGVTPNISYTYHVPNPNSFQSYAWAELPSQTCSRSCGSGVKSKIVKCMSIKGDFVDDYHCGLDTKPKETFTKCNTQPCPPTWKVSEWGPCSVECGNGIKTRTFTCVSMVNGVDQVISSSKCDGLEKPHNSSPCINVCRWKKSMWSQCTRSCGEGYRTRKVSCVKYTGVDVEINATLCNAEVKPYNTIRCRNGPCYVLDGTCVDKSADCRKYYDYERTACDGKYRNWMMTNCLHTCGVCQNGTCVDEVSCGRVDPTVNACNNTVYKVWMHAHCPQTCNICRDCKDCSKYDRKYCTDVDYRGYMAKHCPKYCNLC